MIRVILAVLLSTAIVATVMPAVEQGHGARAKVLAREEVTTLRDTLERFARRNDPVVPEEGGATRPVTVRVPDEVTVRLGGTTSDAESGTVTPTGTVLRWTRGAVSHRVRADVRLVGSLSLGPGRHRLRLRYVWLDGRPTVTVRRFKSEGAAIRPRVRTSIGRRGVPLRDAVRRRSAARRRR